MSTTSASDLNRWLAHPDQIELEDWEQLVVRVKELGVGEATLDVVRCLRNSAAVNSQQKRWMVEDRLLLETVIRFVTNFDLKVTRSEQSWVLIRVSLQFLHNVFVNESCAYLVPHLNGLSRLLGAPDIKTVNFTASVIGHVVKHDANELASEHWALLLEAVSIESNFALLSINTVLRNNALAILNCYEELKLAQRCILLDIIIESKADSCSNEKVIDFVRSRFKQQSTLILTTMKASNHQPLEPSEVTRLLQILIMVSAEESTKNLVQKDKSLLIDTVYLLRMIHDLGKQDPNSAFAPVRKVSDEDAQPPLETDPAFGFKRDLVRLLGNLCWKHKGNQDEVRELDGIALILDCTSIDERNEFIKEWALFALRNLCSDNVENQAFLRQVDRNGPIQTDLEKELGIKLKL